MDSIFASARSAATTAAAAAAAAAESASAAVSESPIAASASSSPSRSAKTKRSMDGLFKSKLFNDDIEAGDGGDAAGSGNAKDEGSSIGFLAGLAGALKGKSDASRSEPSAEATSSAGVLGSVMKTIPFGSKKEEESTFGSFSRTERMKYFVILLIAAGGCFMVAFTFLPLLPIRPQKFALMFSMGSLLTLAAMAMYKGPSEFISSRLAPDQMPVSAFYSVMLIGTLYGALTSSYLLSALFSVGQFSGLTWYLCGAAPGGRTQAFMFNMCVTVTKGLLYPCTKLFK